MHPKHKRLIKYILNKNESFQIHFFIYFKCCLDLLQILFSAQIHSWCFQNVFYNYHTLGDELAQGEKNTPVLIEFTFCDLFKCFLLKEHLDFALLQLFSFKVSEFLNSLCESRNNSSLQSNPAI